MRFLFAVVFLAALAWSGFWWVASSTVEKGLTGWLDARRADGWVVAYDSLDTEGYPSRLDTTITGLELADPATGVSWTAPMFQILALSYKPHHVIVVWPHDQTWASPFETVAVTSETMRGSAVFEPGPSLALDRSTVEFAGVGLSSSAGWTASLAKGQLAVRRTPAIQNSYDFAFETTDLRLPEGMAKSLDRPGIAGDVVERLSAQATVVFDAPWDRFAVEKRRPQPRQIHLDLARATWGELDLKIAGAVDVDTDGSPTGEMTVKATNWREILDLAVAGGAIPESIAPLIESGLKSLARLSGNPDTIDVPIQFAKGRMTLAGLVPLGPAPRLVLR
ncbi:MAG: DUF2125 domain-containing protein [Rhodobacteraceae bacterium]|nr:DUF2125 domain-containing protein [Paracoccaceae bacterium]